MTTRLSSTDAYNLASNTLYPIGYAVAGAAAAFIINKTAQSFLEPKHSLVIKRATFLAVLFTSYAFASETNFISVSSGDYFNLLKNTNLDTFVFFKTQAYASMHFFGNQGRREES